MEVPAAGPIRPSAGRKPAARGRKQVGRQCRKQANGRFEASLKLVSKLQEDASKWGAGSAGRQANGMFEASF